MYECQWLTRCLVELMSNPCLVFQCRDMSRPRHEPICWTGGGDSSSHNTTTVCVVPANLTPPKPARLDRAVGAERERGRVASAGPMQGAGIPIPVSTSAHSAATREWEPTEADFVMLRQWCDSKENWSLDWLESPGESVPAYQFFEALLERDEFVSMSLAAAASQVHLTAAAKFRRWRHAIRDALGLLPLRVPIPVEQLPLRFQVGLDLAKEAEFSTVCSTGPILRSGPLGEDTAEVSAPPRKRERSVSMMRDAMGFVPSVSQEIV